MVTYMEEYVLTGRTIRATSFATPALNIFWYKGTLVWNFLLFLSSRKRTVQVSLQQNRNVLFFLSVQVSVPSGKIKSWAEFPDKAQRTRYDESISEKVVVRSFQNKIVRHFLSCLLDGGYTIRCNCLNITHLTCVAVFLFRICFYTVALRA